MKAGWIRGRWCGVPGRRLARATRWKLHTRITKFVLEAKGEAWRAKTSVEQAPGRGEVACNCRTTITDRRGQYSEELQLALKGKAGTSHARQ